MVTCLPQERVCRQSPAPAGPPPDSTQSASAACAQATPSRSHSFNLSTGALQFPRLVPDHGQGRGNRQCRRRAGMQAYLSTDITCCWHMV